MRAKTNLLLIGCLVVITGCVTSHKTYHAPDGAKVIQSTKILTEKVARARVAADKSRQATWDAQLSAKKLIALAKTMREKLAVVKEKVPSVVMPFVIETQTAAAAQEAEEKILRAKLAEAVALNDILQQRQVEEETARAQLQNDQNDYAGAAASLAQDATNEREFRIRAESQLLKEKFLSILWKVCGGGVILIIIAVIVMWKLGWKAIKL